jgi:hypothetical protein
MVDARADLIDWRTSSWTANGQCVEVAIGLRNELCDGDLKL